MHKNKLVFASDSFFYQFCLIFFLRFYKNIEIVLRQKRMALNCAYFTYKSFYTYPHTHTHRRAHVRSGNGNIQCDTWEGSKGQTCDSNGTQRFRTNGPHSHTPFYFNITTTAQYQKKNSTNICYTHDDAEQYMLSISTSSVYYRTYVICVLEAT